MSPSSRAAGSSARKIKLEMLAIAADEVEATVPAQLVGASA
jgi:hypothetical protein